MEENRELTMEEAFDELQAVLTAMEEGEQTLEESFALYEKGLALVKLCSAKLDGIEQKLTVLGEEHAQP